MQWERQMNCLSNCSLTVSGVNSNRQDIREYHQLLLRWHNTHYCILVPVLDRSVLKS